MHFKSSMVSKDKKAVDVKITEMTVDDLDDVMVIERSSFVTPWSDKMFRLELCLPAAHNLVAKTEGENGRKVVGYINFLIVVDEVHIRDIAIREDFRMRGIASKLIAEMIEISCHQEAVHATLEVRRNNTAARKLYEKFGFEVKGVRPLYYSDTKEDALIMWVDLRRTSDQKGI